MTARRQGMNSIRKMNYSRWKVAAEGIQRKLLGMHQRTQWKFRSVRRNGAAVFLELRDNEENTFGNIQFSGKKDRNAMGIDELVQTAPAPVLNAILRSEAPEQANHVAPTMTGFLVLGTSGKVQHTLLNLLSNVRAEDLEYVLFLGLYQIRKNPNNYSITNRIDLVRAIQKCTRRSVGPKRRYHAAALRVFLNTFGTDLTILKEGIGAVQSPESLGTDPLEHTGDLSQLVYGNKHHAATVEQVEVLQHFAVQAAATKTASTSSSYIRVLSDIDDTLYPGWFDKRYPLHVLYPGVSQLYQMISQQPAAPGTATTTSKGITFLTARPRGWLSIGSNFTSRHLVQLGIPSPTVLPGAIKGLTNNRTIAALKLENFRKYATLYPEYKCVFFGDSSQGDALLGTKLLKLFPDKVKAVFIQDVNPESPSTGDGGDKKQYERSGIVFYNTYVGAGLAAFDKQLITASQLHDLVAACRKALEAAPFKDETQRELRRQELEHDIHLVLLETRGA